MPNFPIIDTHLHVWDQTRLKYSAFEANPLFNHPYHVEDYQRDSGKLTIEAMVFLECYADFWDGGGQYIDEIEFVEGEQKRDPRIRGIVPMAPLWKRNSTAAVSSTANPRTALELTAWSEWISPNMKRIKSIS